MKAQNNALNVLLVDDEENACINLSNLLNNYIDEPLNILGVAHSTTEAEQKIHSLKPDAIFLDIDMQTENSFDFLSRMAPINFEIVFVTAYDEYAIKAFRLNAIDYILKPIDIDELRAAVKKLRTRLQYSQPQSSNDDILTNLINKDNKKDQSKIVLRAANHIEIVDFKDLIFISAISNYSRILFYKKGEEKEMVVSNTLLEYDELLPGHLFFRIHRSYLVNRRFINDISHGASGYEVTVNGRKLPVSRRRYLQLTEFLKTGYDG